MDWPEFDRMLLREYGSYLHNVRPGALGVCGVCSTPVSDGYDLCIQCNRIAPGPGVLGRRRRRVDRAAFMTYAVEGGQAYSVLRGYKNEVGDGRYWTALALWALWFLGKYGACASHAANGGLERWAWATVPSVRSGRTGEHPLHRIVQHVWGDTHPEVQLMVNPDVRTHGRDYNPERFRVGRVGPGSHVIVVDDSWTTGANVQSVATALKEAGAGQVSAMVIGRLLNDAWEPTRKFIDAGRLRRPFDPNACPWVDCPLHS